MGYQEAFADIRADFQRYAKLINGGARRILFPCCGGTGTNIWDLS